MIQGINTRRQGPGPDFSESHEGERELALETTYIQTNLNQRNAVGYPIQTYDIADTTILRLRRNAGRVLDWDNVGLGSHDGETQSEEELRRDLDYDGLGGHARDLQ